MCTNSMYSMWAWVKMHWMQHWYMRHNFPWGSAHNHLHYVNIQEGLSPVFFSLPLFAQQDPKAFCLCAPFVLLFQIHHAQPCPLPSWLQTRSVFPGHDLFTLNAFQSHQQLTYSRWEANELCCPKLWSSPSTSARICVTEKAMAANSKPEKNMQHNNES